MNGVFPKRDRQIFQILIDHHLDSIEDLMTIMNLNSSEEVTREISRFCKTYECKIQAQILHFDKIGLRAFFIHSDRPFTHPYAIREYKLMGSKISYLTLCLTPDLSDIPSKLKKVYRINQIFKPTNNINLLYKDARSVSYNDEWLLNLKEIMVEGELGDIVFYGKTFCEENLAVDEELFEKIPKIYLNDKIGRLHYKYSEIARSYCDTGLISTFLDLKIPDMENYLVIFDKATDPRVFVGGLIGRFPLTELYQADEALICRIQVPEQNFSKLNSMLFTHLNEVCIPYLWLLLDDKKSFNLQQQWNDGVWEKFQLHSSPSINY